ncbi:MAG: hypothetical protein ABL999_00380 [Pyrinomonadaceae bacterium]
MRLLSEKQALARLAVLRDDFASEIREGYEHKAASCLTCETPGSCCLDAHFVNVHISRLEAAAINAKLENLTDEHRGEVLRRCEATIEEYNLSREGDTFDQKFACPLFEKGTGCLVHDDGKPVACTMHACYENASDLPPDELQIAQEQKIDDLNARTYGRREQWLLLPLALKRY